MAGILEFDSSKLSDLLDKHGLEVTWASILKTAYCHLPKFEYIFASPEFRSAFLLDENLLAGLSIGEIGVLYEFSVSWQNHESRKENGQFFTPDDVAIFMAKEAKKFPKGVWLDPCSGIGNLSWHLASMQSDPENFCMSSLILSDRDATALLIARTIFTVSFQRKIKNFFHRLENNFVTFDFLSVSDRPPLEGLTDKGASLEQIPKHDFVLVNPPYLATNRDSKFELSDCADLYAYFLENIIKTSRGFVSVTPQSFTNASKFSSLRAMLLRKKLSLDIYNFDNVPGNLFRGFKFGSKNSNTSNSIRASIMVARQGKDLSYRITPLLRWRSAERSDLMSRLPEFLTPVSFTENFFPKIQRQLLPLLTQLQQSGLNLGSLLHNRTTPYQLFVPAAPRYFICALRKPVNRTSQHTLNFRSQEDRDFAYLVLNSSLIYWWWRVRDGGMTLSLNTLHELPLPSKKKVSRALESALLESEETNLVYKMNAGALQENVKHSEALVKRLNKWILPDFADLLLDCHKNSSL